MFRRISGQINAASHSAHRIEWFSALGVTAVITLLHIIFFSQRGGFWRDEVTLINISKSNSPAVLINDSFPVLMGKLVRVWSAVFGGSDRALQALCLLIGLGIIGALWRTAWRMRRRPPLISLALWGVNGVAFIYGDSLRAYGLGSLLIVLTVAVMWRFLKNPTWPRAAGLAVLAILSVQALYQNAVFIAAISGAAWVICCRARLWNAALKILLAGMAAAATLLPYWASIATPSIAAKAGLRTGFDATTTFTDLGTVFGYPLEQYLYVWAALVMLVLIGGSAKLFAQTPPREVALEDVSLFAAMALLSGIIGYACFLWLAGAQSNLWHYVPLVAFAAICLDLGLPWEHVRWRAILFGFALATMLVATPFMLRELKWRFTNVDILARHLEIAAGPEDFIVVTPWYCGTTFERYYHGQAPWQTLPPRDKSVIEQMQQHDAIRPVLEQVSTTLQTGHRVWIVGWMELALLDTPPLDLPLPPLKHTGWADAPYVLRWRAQTAHFLQQNAREFAQVGTPPSGVVNSDENLKLFIATGWKSTTNAATPTVEPPPTDL